MFSRFQWIFSWGYSQADMSLGRLDFEDPRTVFELIASVQFRVVGSAGLPHFPEDFQPALTQAAQGASMAFAALA